VAWRHPRQVDANVSDCLTPAQVFRYRSEADDRRIGLAAGDVGIVDKRLGLARPATGSQKHNQQHG
jgi:hypothetical protein